MDMDIMVKDDTATNTKLEIEKSSDDMTLVPLQHPIVNLQEFSSLLVASRVALEVKFCTL
jgi:hypothetical protein